MRFMIYRAVILILLLVIGCLIFQTQAYRLRSVANIPAPILSELKRQAEHALESREVPVGAVVVYGDSIVGSGFNTIVRDTNLSGHAEINALIDAHKRLFNQWNRLDRSKLVLYSTYEPCEMCKGAMLNLHITKAVFEAPKSVREQVIATFKSWGYEWQKERLFAPGLQDSLFWRHPDYPRAK
jgi:tRNA(Arg) A34 adenosine deaminase TadA